VQELHYDGPTTVQDAVAAMARGQARPLAGGTDLIVQLREGRRTAATIVDLKRIPELTEITRTADGGWRIGAATSVTRLGRHVDFAAEHHALLESARMIGCLQIQSRASLGGNLCNAAPSADAVPLLISLSAQATIAGPAGRRTVPVEEIATGPGQSCLQPGEILVAIRLPAQAGRWAAKYLRFTPRREMDIAIAGSGVWLHLDNNNNIIDAKITLASVAPTPLVATKAQTMLVGEPLSKERMAQAAEHAAGEARPISDTRGSADYRRQLVAVLTRRALAACATELGCDEE
jgi:CO/xanthine dehydrogenase FAD-binding subunit